MDCVRTDAYFKDFIHARFRDEILKKKGIPECILSVSHRVTKYPLMIEAIIKYSKDQANETEALKKALNRVKVGLIFIIYENSSFINISWLLNEPVFFFLTSSKLQLL